MIYSRLPLFHLLLTAHIQMKQTDQALCLK